MVCAGDLKWSNTRINDGPTEDQSQWPCLNLFSKRCTMAILIQHTSVLVLLALVSAAFRSTAPQGNATRSSPTTQIVLLGTGTPGWDPDSSGPATAIVVNGTPYLIDFGPGVVRRAGAAYRKGVKALLPTNLHVVFLTHRHVDHTIGYSDLIFSPAQASGARKLPMEVYGPKGLKDMTEHILKGHMLNPDDPRYKVIAHEITPGIVYKDDNVMVKAFPVAHGDVEAFGF